MPLGEPQFRFNELSSTVAFSSPLSHKALPEEPGNSCCMQSLSNLSCSIFELL